MVAVVAEGAVGGTDWAVCVVVVSIVANGGLAPDGKAIAMMLSVGGLLGPQVVRVSGMAETECASGKPSV